MPLRYWALCRTFAEQGHEVIWWSSDFSHLTKSKRNACPNTDGFSVRLIKTPAYKKNISLARLKNHKAFAQGFYQDAMIGLTSGELKAPDRIVVSLPPLGVAEAAFKVREFINQNQGSAGASRTASTQGNQSSVISHPPSVINHHPSVINHHDCEVIVDIMDAWPETFYQVIPKPLRKLLGPILMAPMHRSAKRAYQGADKISAVGQSYLDLAARYLNNQPSIISHQLSSAKPMHLCYHGTDLDRFEQNPAVTDQMPATKDPSVTSHQSSVINHQPSAISHQPLKAVYLGAMGSGYDLITIIEVAARWKAEGQFPFQIHFAGTGPQLEELKKRALELSLINHQSSTINHQSSLPNSAQPSVINNSKRIVFHGFLKKEAISELLLNADLALVPNKPGSLVACPYKAGEYAAAGLPMMSCLGGELGHLLDQWNAGSRYSEGDTASLHAAFKNVSDNLDLLNQQSLNTQKMAEALFDRSQTYPALAEFILALSS